MSTERARAVSIVLLALACGGGSLRAAAGGERLSLALAADAARIPIPVCATGARGCSRPPGDHGAGAALRAIYGRPGAGLLWSRGGRPTAQALGVLGQLEQAARYGLQEKDYRVDAITRLLPGLRAGAGEPSAVAVRFDAQLSASALQLLADLHFGRVDPRAAGFELGERRRPFDLAGALLRLAGAADVRRAIEAVEPPFYHYRLLEQALERYRALARRPQLTRLPRPKRPLGLGAEYAGAPALRRLLAALGDLPAGGEAGPSSRIDEALVAAIRAFQSRHGLKVDGVIGRATFAALVTPLAYRVRQIDLTLERWRWLPVFRVPPIIVNIPEFRLFAFRTTADRKSSILQMKVIVGRNYPLMRTPVFVADMRYVVFRPYWNIPYDIMRREMLARLRSDPDYLGEQHLQIVAESGDAALPLPATPANLAGLAAGRLRLRQEPGPDNALGLIKFIFPNAHSVYLHSTPAHRLFGHARRAFSHGCIRVSDPVALAALVLRDTPGGWTPAKITAAMNGTRTFRVALAKPVPVMILYGTVLATESGPVLFFEDLYGNDARLAALLHLKPIA